MSAISPLREVYLRPGEFCFGEGRLRISTLLGSCVSIILWHPVLNHGGMCHYMLPSRQPLRGDLPLNGKYGDEAMALFMRELGRRHTAPAQYRVHAYGGGGMFEGRAASAMDIGRQNIEQAHALLAGYGFTLAHGHLGGFGHRKIVFDVWSGNVKLVHEELGKTKSQ
jgi:chemotaxis protein CheD